jgi:hypothetical protein
VGWVTGVRYVGATLEALALLRAWQEMGLMFCCCVTVSYTYRMRYHLYCYNF